MIRAYAERGEIRFATDREDRDVADERVDEIEPVGAEP